MKKGAWLAALVLALVVGAVIALVVFRASTTPSYPTTPQGWAARWEAAAAEFGRTPGENWDVWLDVFAELDTATDRARVAELTDRLRPIERFTVPVPGAIGTLVTFDQATETLGKTRRPVVEVIIPALHDTLAAGDFDGAADWLERAWALARVTDASGTIIGGMVQTAITTAVYESLRPHLPAIAKSGHARVREAMNAVAIADPLWSLRMERELGLGVIQDDMADSLLMAKDQLRLYDQALIDWSLYESTGDVKARERVRRLAERLNTSTIYNRRRMALDMMLPALDRVGPSFRAGIAERDATRVMLALESYHTVHGQYPDTLDALVPAYLDRLPPDPFRPAQSFGYRRVDSADMSGAYLLYTVGADGVDDGGQPAAPNSGNPLTNPNVSGDHVFKQTRAVPAIPREADSDPDAHAEDAEHP